MKAKYSPCLGVKFGAVDRGDIGEDFGWWTSNQEAPIKVHYRLQRGEVECWNCTPCSAGIEATVRKLKLPGFWAGRVS